MPKTKVSLTLDEEVVAALNAIQKGEDIKNSTMANKVLRRFFLRPGKKFHKYRLQEKAVKGVS